MILLNLIDVIIKMICGNFDSINEKNSTHGLPNWNPFYSTINNFGILIKVPKVRYHVIE